MNSKNLINSIEGNEGNNNIIQETLEKGGFFNSCPNGNITKVGNNLFVADSGEFNVGKKGQEGFTGNGNVVLFLDEKGQVIFNLSGSRAYIATSKGYENAGYIEKLEGKEFVLYKIKGDREQIKIDKYSIEYFKAWEDILFYSSYDQNLKNTKNSELPTDTDSIDKLLYMISLFKGIKPIHLFKYIQTNDINDTYIKKLFDVHYAGNNILLDQCGDERFDKIGDPITYEEIDFYLGEEMISEEYANLCKARIDDRLNMIEEMNQLDANKQNEIEKVKQEYAKEIKIFKENIMKI
ncbi:MAG: hypothetical protein V3575_00180 [Candidatus Absconditabacteria bacterium]